MLRVLMLVTKLGAGFTIGFLVGNDKGFQDGVENMKRFFRDTHRVY